MPDTPHDFSDDQRQQIIQALAERNAHGACPRCGSSKFTLVSGYFNHFIQHQLAGVNIGGTSVPTVVVVCNNCGWLAEHALGVLGLLPHEDTQDPEANS